MNTVENSRVFLRKNLAQDRLDRLREDLKVKRKLQEKLEKFGLHSPSKGSSLSVDIFVDKFLPDGNQVDFRGAKRAVEVKPSTGRNIDKSEVVHKKCPPQERAHCVVSSYTEDLSELSKSAEKRKKARRNLNLPSNGAECFVSNNEPNRLSDTKIEHSSQISYKKRRRGVGPERLEKARKSSSVNSSRNEDTTLHVKGSILHQTSRNADAQPSRPSIQTRSRKSHAGDSNFSFSKLPSDIHQPIEMRSSKRECAVTSPEPSSSSHPQTRATLQQPAAVNSSFSFSNFECSAILSVDHDSSEYDMEVDMDVDADVGDSSSCSNFHSDSSTRISEKWLAEKEEQVSSVVHKIERIREESAYLARHENYIADVDMNLSVPSGDFLIVVDTNIFLSHMRFLHRLLKSNISNYRAHVLVVPWVVIQEIDYAMKKKDPQLASQAKLANYFIFECLKKENSNFFGQSFEDFKVNFKNTVSIDDFLLQYCLKLISLRNNVVLLSDDKNLCSKCMFSNVGAYTKDEFEKTFNISPLQEQ